MPPPLPPQYPQQSQKDGCFTTGAKVVGWIVIGIIILGIIRGVMDVNKKDNDTVASDAGTESFDYMQSKAIITIRAKDLIDSYNANEVAADEIYKGRILEVMDKITDIRKDAFDKMHITLFRGSLSGLDCTISPIEKEKVIQLKKGDYITIRGKCEGMFMSQVGLKDCIVLPPNIPHASQVK